MADESSHETRRGVMVVGWGAVAGIGGFLSWEILQGLDEYSDQCDEEHGHGNWEMQPVERENRTWWHLGQERDCVEVDDAE